MSNWPLDLLNGLSFGAILFLVSSGFTIAFGQLRIMNLAHGAFFALGAYLAQSTYESTGSFALTVLVSGLGAMLVGLLLERSLLRRFHLNELPQILLTIGVAYIIAECCRIVWGGYPRTMATPPLFRGAIDLGFTSYPKYRLFVIAVALALGFILWLIQERTQIGRSVRASVDDRDIAETMRIDTSLVFSGMFAASAFLAGLAGAMGAPFIGAYPGLEFDIVPLTLVVTIIGGIGSLGGALAASFLIGIVDAFAKSAFPELAYFTLFAPMVAILAFRPGGLFGRA